MDMSPDQAHQQTRIDRAAELGRLAADRTIFPPVPKERIDDSD